MNQAQLAAELGVSPAAISQWSAAGLPFRRVGKRRKQYDVDEARTWCVANGKGVEPRIDRPGHMAKILQPAALSPASLVEFLRAGFCRHAVAPAAWLAHDLRIDPERAAAAWWNASASLFADLVADLGFDPLNIPEPPAPDPAAVAAELDRLRRNGWDESA